MSKDRKHVTTIATDHGDIHVYSDPEVPLGEVRIEPGPGEKSLGQIAFESIFVGRDWSLVNPDSKIDYERGAQAVKDAIVNDAGFESMCASYPHVEARLKAEGAAEERERLASIHDDKAKELASLLNSPFDLGSSEEPFSRAYRGHKSEASWLRAGGKP